MCDVIWGRDRRTRAGFYTSMINTPDSRTHGDPVQIGLDPNKSLFATSLSTCPGSDSGFEKHEHVWGSITPGGTCRACRLLIQSDAEVGSFSAIGSV